MEHAGEVETDGVVVVGAAGAAATAAAPEDGRVNANVHDVHDVRQSWAELVVCTYNVAGLPWPLSSSPDPRAFCRRIGRAINRYELVLLQEDFWHYEEVARGALHPYRTVPSYTAWHSVGDGLSMYSHYALEQVVRVPWSVCHGYLSGGCDCLASKGFQFAAVHIPLYRSEHEDAPSPDAVATLHVYNLHMDAGDGDGDREARRTQMRQWAQFVREHSRGAPLIVAGDTNLDERHPYDADTLRQWLSTEVPGLQRAECAAVHAETGAHLDMIFYRSGRDVSLRVVECGADDRDGDFHCPVRVDTLTALSDHHPLWMRFEVQPRASHRRHPRNTSSRR